MPNRHQRSIPRLSRPRRPPRALKRAFAVCLATSVSALLTPSADAVTRGETPTTVGQAPTTAGQAPAADDEAPATPGLAPSGEASRAEVTEGAPPPVTAEGEATPEGEAMRDGAAEILSWAPSGELLTRTLRNGLVLVVARDRSLAVAAIGLSFPTGYADDPKGQEGLTRALALHLEQGSRELRPGGRLARIHGAGGYTAMAVGAKQTRYEGLIPVWSLWDTLTDLTGVLRNPTVNEIRWRQSVSRATKDRSGVPRIGAQSVASAWSEPALLAGSARSGKPLTGLHPAKVRAEIQRRFAVHEATLIVVSPFTLEEVADKVEALYEDRPPGQRVRRPLTPPPPTVMIGSPKGRSKQQRFTWPIGGSYDAIWRARVVCGALNRQPRAAGEPAGAKLKCVLHEDPRRPALQVSTFGLQPSEARQLVIERLTRLAQDPVDHDVVDIERERQARALVDELHAPLSLASLLARALGARDVEADGRVGISTALDLESLSSPTRVTDMAGRLAARLLEPRPLAPPAPVESADPASPPAGPEDTDAERSAAGAQ